MRKRLLLLLTAAALTLGATALPAVAGSTDGSDSTDTSDAGGIDGITAVTDADIASAPIKNCSGYGTVNSFNGFSTKANVCTAYFGRTTSGGYKVGVVARFQCYRNGSLFGTANGGCRWQGNLSKYRTDPVSGARVHSYSSFFARPGSASSDYWQDSGRIYSGYTVYAGGTVIQVCEDHWNSSLNNIVHYRGLDLSDQGTHQMSDRCTPWIAAANTD